MFSADVGGLHVVLNILLIIQGEFKAFSRSLSFTIGSGAEFLERDTVPESEATVSDLAIVELLFLNFLEKLFNGRRLHVELETSSGDFIQHGRR